MRSKGSDSEPESFDDVSSTFEENVGQVPMRNLETPNHIYIGRTLTSSQEKPNKYHKLDLIYFSVMFVIIMFIFILQLVQFSIVSNVLHSDIFYQLQNLDIQNYKNEFSKTLKNIDLTVNKTNTILNEFDPSYYENEFMYTLKNVNATVNKTNFIIDNLNISYYEDEFYYTIKNINATVNRTNNVISQLARFFPH